jgi:hypothetical protein
MERFSHSFTLAHHVPGSVNPLFHSAKKRKKEPEKVSAKINKDQRQSRFQLTGGASMVESKNRKIELKVKKLKSSQNPENSISAGSMGSNDN